MGMAASGYFNDFGVWVEDGPDPEMDQEGRKLAELITQTCEMWDCKPVTLTGPAEFEATGKRGVAMKARLIGMEEFRLKGAYLANKKDLVLQMAPLSAEKFQFIEVPVGVALEKFSGMREVLDQVFKKDTIEALAAMRKEQIVSQERRRVQQRAQQYDDNFGAW
jgi:hypothetical protein